MNFDFPDMSFRAKNRGFVIVDLSTVVELAGPEYSVSD
jgi:hypothetical protein